MIETILIKNFRCIKSLQINPAKINLIVGRNNTGKTSILEAIEKYYQLKPHADKRIVPVPSNFRTRHEMFRYVINVKEKEATIAINNLQLKLYVDDILFEREMKDFLANMLKIDRKKLDNLAQELKYYNEYYVFGEMLDSKSLFIPKVILSSILHGFYEKGEIDFQKLSYVSEEIFKMNEIPLELILSPIKLEETLSKLKSTKLEEDVKIKLDVEKTIKKYEIEKIERFQDQFVIFKDGSAIPLDILGDGFLQMISILYYLIKCKDIALLDEPTAFMHPGYIRKFVEYLIDVVKDKNMQVFISTHNIDLLETFLDFGEDDNFVKDNLKIIRLTRVNGDIRARELSFKEALEESEELSTDLRGI